MRKNCMCNQEKSLLLRDISIVDFVLVDLIEYLDTHPHDCKALDYFIYYSRIKKQLMQEFADKFYPLSPYLSTDQNEWSWGLAPLPWEGEC